MEKEKPDILKKELLDKAPGLSKASKDNPFEVPENYFSGLPEKVQNLKNRQAQKSPRMLINYSSKKVLAYAAAFVLMVSLGLSVIFLSQQEEHDSFAEADEELYEAYFSYIAEYDEGLYYEILAADEAYYPDTEEAYETFLWEEDLEDDPYFEYLVDYMHLYQYSPEELVDSYQ